MAECMTRGKSASGKCADVEEQRTPDDFVVYAAGAPTLYLGRQSFDSHHVMELDGSDEFHFWCPPSIKRCRLGLLGGG